MEAELTYEWMDEQITKLEKSVIGLCDYCTGNTKEDLEFNENAHIDRKPKEHDEMQINKIRMIDGFINNYEFLVLEEIKINKRKGQNYKEWQELLERLESSRKIIDKLTNSLQYSLDIKSNSNIDILSKISLIFLPLSFITGYFGMNFTTMGMVGKNINRNGVLMWKNGHTFVRLLLLFILIGTLLFLAYLERYTFKNKSINNTLSSLAQVQGTADDFS